MPAKSTTRVVAVYMDEKAHEQVFERAADWHGRQFGALNAYLRYLVTKDMRENGYPDFDTAIVNGGYRPRGSGAEASELADETTGADFHRSTGALPG